MEQAMDLDVVGSEETTRDRRKEENENRDLSTTTTTTTMSSTQTGTDQKKMNAKDLLYLEPKGEDSPFLVTRQTPIASISKAKPTFQWPQNSAIAARVKNFLPLMKKANEELEKQLAADPSKKNTINIEHIEDDEKPVIEMDLSLGVLEEKQPLCEKKLRLRKEGDDGDEEENDEEEGSAEKTNLEGVVLSILQSATGKSLQEEEGSDDEEEEEGDTKEMKKETKEGWEKELLLSTNTNKRKRKRNRNKKKTKGVLIQPLD